ncbi:hypothetical protein [Microbispora sp. H10885]|uniref:hypothetical protein n=1 Tax=Microbispora sp. H10885 TaxID=2729110 RepID=UPI001603AAF3|nr:hypothetical protein [Microbispora sp. H10885]
MVKRAATALAVIAMGATALATAPAHADPVTSTPTPTPSATPTPTPTPTPTADSRRPYVPEARILWFGVNPDVVVVGGRGSATVSASVRTKDVRKVTFTLSGSRGHGGGHGGHDGPWWGKRKSGGPHDGPSFDTFSQSWSFDRHDREGVYRVRIEAEGLDGRTLTAERSFRVKRKEWHAPRPSGPKATRIVGFDATPEPVRKGRALTLEGELQVAQCYSDWYFGWNGYTGRRGGHDDCYDSRDYWHDWHWLGSQEVGVYFLPAGSRKWRYVDTIRTDGDGDFATRVRAYQSGTWGVRFDGTRRLKGSEATDYVKVIRHH